MASTASEYLRAKIKAFVSDRDISLRKMSQETGVDYTTLHRIHAGKKKGVEFFDARRIITYIDPENALPSLTQYYPREVKEIGPQALSNSQLDKDIALMQYVAEAKDTYDMFIFISEGLPKKWHDVTNEFGRRGISILEDLLDRGVVKSGPEDELQAFTHETLTLPTNLLKSIARLNLDSVDTVSPGCLLRNRAMGLNLVGATKAYEALAEADSKLQEIEQNPEYKGALAMLFSLICGAHSTRKSSEVLS